MSCYLVDWFVWVQSPRLCLGEINFAYHHATQVLLELSSTMQIAAEFHGGGLKLLVSFTVVAAIHICDSVCNVRCFFLAIFYSHEN